MAWATLIGQVATGWGTRRAWEKGEEELERRAQNEAPSMKLDRIRRAIDQRRGRWATRARAPSALNQHLEGHRWGDSKRNCAPGNNQYIWAFNYMYFFLTNYFG